MTTPDYEALARDADADPRLARIFAAIFARLDALEVTPGTVLNLTGMIEHTVTRLDRLEARFNGWTRGSQARAEATEQRIDAISHLLCALEARISAPVAPESVVNVSEVSQEPGYATAAHSVTDADLLSSVPAWLHGEVAAALRVYRKVQSVHMEGEMAILPGLWTTEARALLAWLKEGDAQ